MFESEYIPAVEGMSRPHPTLTVAITKLDNGYVVVLQEIPKRKQRKPRVHKPQPNPFEGMEPDQIIDQMIDGVGAVLRTFRQAEAEEEWKGGEDREKVRTAFKAMFPGLAQQAIDMTEKPEPPDPEELRMPRSEQQVFGSPEELMEYLKKNL